MKTTISKWATQAAGAGVIALLLATPAVAQSRGDWNRNNNNQGWQQQQQQHDSRGTDNRSRDNNNSYRDNQRINGSGRIRSGRRHAPSAQSVPGCQP